MDVFDSWTSFRSFQFEVMLKNRYVFTKQTNAFLRTIVITSESRHTGVPKGQKLWRAQLHEPNQKAWEVKEPFTAERMKPLSSCKEGRINPKNIPCLYLANDDSTAMSEVRPWVGAIGTIAEFLLLRDLTLVDCSEKISTSASLKWLAGVEPPPEDRERFIWGQVNASFSEPTTSTDTTAHYAPTQILAEMFRHAKLDGIIYNSSVAHGKNVALFNLADAEVGDRSLFHTKDLVYTFGRS